MCSANLDIPVICLCSDIVLSIDYEYASMNFLPYDIGNHFCEYAGIYNVYFFFKLWVRVKAAIYMKVADTCTAKARIGKVRVIKHC